MFSPIELSKKGKIEVTGKITLTKENLSKLYTPGVAEVVKEVMKDNSKVYDLTWKGNTVAIVSDGTAILGLGNQGPEAALPVMEAKALLFKELAGINAVPLVLRTTDPDEIVAIVKAIAPSFGGINMEDIAAPNCFVIKEKLKKELDIPIFHDDQYGTAIVVLAGLMNAAKVVQKKLENLKIVIVGAGAAGIASAKLLKKCGCGKNIIMFDSKGAIYQGRQESMNFAKEKIARETNPGLFKGTLSEALDGADVFIGLSGPNLINRSDVQRMNKGAIVFALANPVPEIMPEEALAGGAVVVATGRSDFPNQINNALVFPGIFRGALDTRTLLITDEIKVQSAFALAGLVSEPDEKHIMPSVLDDRVVKTIAGVFEKKV
jgi:malate dehydrogenase (oxaloacetate-decarboxylating)